MAGSLRFARLLRIGQAFVKILALPIREVIVVDVGLLFVNVTLRFLTILLFLVLGRKFDALQDETLLHGSEC